MGKKILMVCYYFPPLRDVGCKRSVAFSKYLADHGWQPYVLSVKNPDKHFCQPGADVPPENVPISYTRTLFNVYWFFGKANGLISRIFSVFGIRLKRNYLHDLFSIPDIFLGWIPKAVHKGRQLIKNHDIDCIYVSCSPFSSAIAGLIIKKLTVKPLVVDFRDPFYTMHPGVEKTPKFRNAINRLIENKIIAGADQFVLNNEEVKRGFISAYPEFKDKITAIHNGFDSSFLPDGESEKFEKFTIIYAGNMYLEAVSADSFFEALLKLKKQQIINMDNFQFLYFGGCHQHISNLSLKYKVDDMVVIEKPTPYPVILDNLRQAHLQLLRIMKPMISTKLFEGIALNVPFLATIPTGEVADMIAEFSPSSYLVHDDSAATISANIVQAMQDYKEGNIKSNDVERFMNEFSREKMTYKLEEAFNKALHLNVFKGDDLP